jgi:primosomal protein N' (replication factor Y)
MAQEKNMLYVDVIMPLAVKGTFTYHLTETQKKQAEKGKRVIVQFGKRRLYSGIIYRLHHEQPRDYKTKPVESILDQYPIINEYQFRFWEWIADYYMCTLGEVYKAALPSGLKLESETKVLYNPEFKDNSIELTSNEDFILEVVRQENLIGINELAVKTGRKDILPIVNSLMNKKAVIIEEKLKDAYKPKKETYIHLNFPLDDQERMEQIFSELQRAPRQVEILMTFIKLARQKDKQKEAEIPKKELLKESQASQSALDGLISKEIFRQVTREVSRLKDSASAGRKAKQLTVAQSEAMENIKKGFVDKNVALLHGVTSSGKTELYIQLIQEQIDQGKQVLYLLPEIALTSQIIERLKFVFGNTVGIYHSKFSDNERVEVYNDLLHANSNFQKYQVVLGVRSSVFLPFSNLGLVIIDEEHENTYKQFDPAPRYSARDAAILLASMHDAKVLLGSATPSIESYYNAKSGKYAHVELNSRYLDIQLPEIVVANILKAQRKKEMSSHFTPELMEHMKEALNNNEQVILFQNRRGFAPFLECELCGWIPECKHCDVSLTYHKRNNKLVCHYCGYQQNIPKVCPSCGSNKIITRGFGTEKVEDELEILFPDAKIKRMDLDTTRSRNAYENIIHAFESGEIDILVGTQMVSKGLDFDNVNVVGILNADNMLNFPDFRAFERSYQLMAQVSGRAGRKNKRGTVIIQTSKPSHPIIKNVIENDYRGMYQSQLSERKEFMYPPFYKLIRILLKHKKIDKLNHAANSLTKELQKTFGYRVLGPQDPIVGRIQNNYLKHIIIKIEREKSLKKSKEVIRKITQNTINQPDNKALQINFDVDPL